MASPSLPAVDLADGTKLLLLVETRIFEMPAREEDVGDNSFCVEIWQEMREGFFTVQVWKEEMFRNELPNPPPGGITACDDPLRFAIGYEKWASIATDTTDDAWNAAMAIVFETLGETLPSPIAEDEE